MREIIIALLFTVSLSSFAAPTVTSNSGLVQVMENEIVIFELKLDDSNDFVELESESNSIKRSYKRIDQALLMGNCLIITDMDIYSPYHDDATIRKINVYNYRLNKEIKVKDNSSPPENLYGKSYYLEEYQWGVIFNTREGTIHSYVHLSKKCDLTGKSFSDGISAYEIVKKNNKLVISGKSFYQGTPVTYSISKNGDVQ